MYKRQGIHASPVRFERSKIADHANNLVLNVRENLTRTLSKGVELKLFWALEELKEIKKLV